MTAVTGVGILFEVAIAMHSDSTKTEDHKKGLMFMNHIDFDFKKVITQKIHDDIKSVLKEKGFALLPSNTYIREKEGLLQILYFRVEKTKLRPWVSFMPIYLPCIRIVSYGSDNSRIDISLRSNNNPYAGFGWVFVSYNADKTKEYEEYKAKTVPQFNALVSSITNAILPEMERISSLSRFVKCLQTDRFMWGNTVRLFPTDQDIINIAQQSGVQRIKALQNAIKGVEALLPNALFNIIVGANTDTLSDKDADAWFENYCNSVRKKFSLSNVQLP